MTGSVSTPTRQTVGGASRMSQSRPLLRMPKPRKQERQTPSLATITLGDVR